MKQYKAVIIGIILTIVPFNSAYAIAGFGLQGGNLMFSVDASYPETGSEYITLTNGAFDGAFNIGGYLYLDIIPFIDLEVDFNARGNSYDIDFQNASPVPMPTIPFGWASTCVYYTARKKIVGFSIPFLAATKFHAGGGINTHLTTPIANVDMVTELLGGDLLNADPSALDQNLEDYLTNEDNYVESTGVHVQAALQFKLLMIDTFVVYRYTIADDVVPGSSGFGSVNVRLGMGF
tara:strand:- start:221 stop:925 length:705 start_codon:yes stop_codon:yes gene_type:complete